MKKIKFLTAALFLFAAFSLVCCTAENEPIDPAIDLDGDGTIAISTAAVTNIDATIALSGGTIGSDGGSAITARGIVWSTTQNPTIANSKTTDGSGTGTYSSILAGLTASTTYYVRAYATNTVGTTYGNQVSFVTTGSSNLPSLTTSNVTSITSSSALIGGNITADGGSAITARGTVWAETQNPTTANSKTVDGSGTGSFSSAVSGLTADKIYYARAYATNASGTAYGNQVTFTTGSSGPIYVLGDTGPGGGRIFFVDGSGQHGMEVAPASTQWQTQWGCYSTSIPGTSSAVGSGLANSNLILNFHNSINFYTNPAQCQTYVAPVGVITSMGDVAAKECDDLVFNGFSDWYLPSSGELVLIYTNLNALGLGDLGTEYLASSTQSTTGDVKMVQCVDFTGGTVGNQGKYNLVDYRAIRNF